LSPLRVHIGHHFFGSGNIGDDLMLAGFLGAIQPWAAKLALTCCTAHDIASQRLRFPSVDWRSYDPEARAQCIEQCDVWLGLGDTPFQATGGNTWFLDHLVQEAAWCREFGRPMHYLGVGVNEREVFDFPQTRSVLAQAERLWTRDGASGNLIRSAGGANRVIDGADLAHIALQRMRFAAPEEGVLGLVLNFEDPRQFGIGQIAALIEKEPGAGVRWLVQEVRPLPGSETELYGQLPEFVRARALWRAPDYAGSAAAADLIAPWGTPGQVFTSRYHGALIGAWMGARTVAFRRSDKVAGAAEQLGLTLVSDLGDTAAIQSALAESQPVARGLLRGLAELSRQCCEEFLAAAGLDLASAPAYNQRNRPMKISVVIPSYNQAAYLPATLESVCDQDYPDLEVLVYDGGSTDGSAEILRDWTRPAGGQPIRWVSRKDHGQADAINRGMRECTGDIIAYLNSDDVYFPGALAAAAAHFREHPDCLVVYGQAHHLQPDGSFLEVYPTEPWNYERLLETCFLCQPAVFWRREAVERFGYFDDSLNYALDYEYWLRLGRETPFHYLEGQFLAGSRVHADTKTLSQRVPTHLEIVPVIQRYAQRPEPVLRWIKHLAHHRAAQMECADRAYPELRRRFMAKMVAHCLIDAHAHGVVPDESFLKALDADLTSVDL
jgi:hypothetical protein